MALLALTSSFWLVQPAMAAATGTKTMRLEDMPNGRVFNLGMYSFVKTADNEYMQTSNFTCPNGKYIAGQYVRCYEDENASVCAATDIDCANGTVTATYTPSANGYATTYQCACNSGYEYDTSNRNCVFKGCAEGQKKSERKNACITPVETNSSSFCSSATGFLQDFTQADCNELTRTLPTDTPTPGDKRTACLMDERDGKIYAVRRYADDAENPTYDQCWLAQNLVFGDCAGSGKDAEFNSYYQGSIQNKVASGYYGICRDAAGLDGAGNYDGYLYNWQAAMNNVTANYNNSNYDNRVNGDTEATHDICPLGWHVPTGNDDDNVREWGLINNAVGSSAGSRVAFFRTSGANAWNATSKSTIAGGGSGTTLSSQGSNSYWWSSTVSSATGARNMDVNSSATYPAHSSNKYYGFSVRCLLGN